MELKLVRSSASDLDVDAVVVIEFEGSARPEFVKPLAALYTSGEIRGKRLELTLLHGLEGYKARRVLVAGAGKREKFDAAELRKLAGAAVRFLDGKGIATLAFALDDDLTAPEHVAATAEGAVLGAWEPDYLKTDKEEKNESIRSVAIATRSEDPAVDAALEKGRIIAEAANLSRDIAVEPPNLLTPLILADRARRMAEACGLSFEMLDQDRMRQLGMGALLGEAPRRPP
jgi:leucyl aminopeptidase